MHYNSSPATSSSFLPLSTSSVSSSLSASTAALHRVENAWTFCTTALEREKRIHEKVQDSLDTLRLILNSEFPEQVAFQLKKTAEELKEIEEKKKNKKREGEDYHHHQLTTKNVVQEKTAAPRPSFIQDWERVQDLLGRRTESPPHPSSSMMSYFDNFVHEWCLLQNNSNTTIPAWKEEEESLHLHHRPSTTSLHKSALSPSSTSTSTSMISLSSLWLSMTVLPPKVAQHSRRVNDGIDRCISRVQQVTTQLLSIEKEYHAMFRHAFCAAALEESTVEALWRRKKRNRGGGGGERGRGGGEEKKEEERGDGSFGNAAERRKDGDVVPRASNHPSDPHDCSSRMSHTLRVAYATLIQRFLQLPLSPSPPSSSSEVRTPETGLHRSQEQVEEDEEDIREERKKEHAGSKEKQGHEKVKAGDPRAQVISFLQDMQKNGTFVVPSLEIFNRRKSSRMILDHLPPPLPRPPPPRSLPSRKVQQRPSSHAS